MQLRHCDGAEGAAARGDGATFGAQRGARQQCADDIDAPRLQRGARLQCADREARLLCADALCLQCPDADAPSDVEDDDEDRDEDSDAYVSSVEGLDGESESEDDDEPWRVRDGEVSLRQPQPSTSHTAKKQSAQRKVKESKTDE